MTKKQALNYLRSSGFSKEQIKAVVDALQEPTTKNESGVDCISRADARSLICDIDLKYHTFGMTRKAFKDLYNGMDELPPVTLIRPKGHWIWCGGSHKCSNCEEYTCFSHKVRYCPNCGADMREVEE